MLLWRLCQVHSAGLCVTTCVSATVHVCDHWLSERAETGVLVGFVSFFDCVGFSDSIIIQENCLTQWYKERKVLCRISS